MSQGGSNKLKAFAAGGALALALATALWAGTAVSEVCAPALPPPLAALCQNQPASSAKINGNFQALASAIQKKTGTLGSPVVNIPGCVDLVKSTTSTATFGNVYEYCPDGTAPVVTECSTTAGKLTGRTANALTSGSPYKVECTTYNPSPSSYTITVTARCCALAWGN
jgi:hypothetical protein